MHAQARCFTVLLHVQ